MKTLSKLGGLGKLARHWVWVMPALVGVAFVIGGTYMALEGRSAHDDVRDNVVREAIVVSEDAPSFGGQTVDSADKAQAQSDAILGHTLAATGGYLYAEMGQYLLPEGTYMLPNGTYATADGGTTQDVTQAAKDSEGNAINTTTNVSLAAKNASDQPIRAWTSDKKLAATDASGAPLPNTARNTAQTSAFLRTSLGVAVMGFKVSDLVVGIGAFLVLIGVLNVIIMAPVTYWATVVADEHERNRAKAAAGQAATASRPTTLS
jgi:hypothetical protein